MTNNGPTDGKGTVRRRSDEQHAHTICHECARGEKLVRAKNPTDALAKAIEGAIEHARASGHTNVDHELLTVPLDSDVDNDTPATEGTD